MKKDDCLLFVGINTFSNSQPMDYFVDDETKSQLDRPIEWNTEYNYGRNYKHSEGQEWGTGYNNQYSTANIMKKRPKLEVSPAQWTLPPNIDESKMHAAGMYKMNAGLQHANILPSNILKKQFQEKTGNDAENWHNWPKKSITWPNLLLFKKNQYEKQQIPWWDINNNQPKQKQPFWLGSIGWTGDLGPYGEVPPPPWLS
ncbi:unnamed protein product [Wuchereria bancrofti]|uniref:Uncharacterized protein n=1 Tax=Wuchereria bancrofti TaxID=6293 RepID=A0A3P7EBY4_WUCBA|nr:unnamed protein product [Wuchereria bancrofti]